VYGLSGGIRTLVQRSVVKAHDDPGGWCRRLVRRVFEGADPVLTGSTTQSVNVEPRSWLLQLWKEPFICHSVDGATRIE
jgi:hypothetical protein